MQRQALQALCSGASVNMLRFSSTARGASDTMRAAIHTANVTSDSVKTAVSQAADAAKTMPKGTGPGMRFQNHFLVACLVTGGSAAAYMMLHNTEKSAHQQDVTHAAVEREQNPSKPPQEAVNSTAVKGSDKSLIQQAQDDVQKKK